MGLNSRRSLFVKVPGNELLRENVYFFLIFNNPCNSLVKTDSIRSKLFLTPTGTLTHPLQVSNKVNSHLILVMYSSTLVIMLQNYGSDSGITILNMKYS